MSSFLNDNSSLRLRLISGKSTLASTIEKDKRSISDEELNQSAIKATNMSIKVEVDSKDNEKSGYMYSDKEDLCRVFPTKEKYLNKEISNFVVSSESSADEYQQQRLLFKSYPQQSEKPLIPDSRLEDNQGDGSPSSSTSNTSCNFPPHLSDTKNISNRRTESETKLNISTNQNYYSKSSIMPSRATAARRYNRMSPIKACEKYPKSSWKITIMRNHSLHVSDLVDIFIRLIFVIVFCKMETTTAFKRFIHLNELPLYQNPRTEDYISPMALLVSVTMGPFLVTLFHLFLTNDRSDFRAATWAWTLCLCLNGFATSLLKVSVGRPRPDYYYRCFPDGVMQLKAGTPTIAFSSLLSESTPFTSTASLNMMDAFNCTGNWRDINEGRKSFPSGHSSFAFASFGFIAYYLSGKLHAFNRNGRGESWRLCISLTPLTLATLVAVSRTCDYHHHWQDVVVGSLIGMFVSYGVYRFYYPSIFMINSHKPHSRETTFKTSREKLHCCYRYQNRHCNDNYTDAFAFNSSSNITKHKRRLQKSISKEIPSYDPEEKECNFTEDEQHETEICSSGSRQLLLTNVKPKTLQNPQQRYLSKCF